MVRDEIQQFLRFNQTYTNLCGELFDTLQVNERTVAAFTRCGTDTGTAFLSNNFSRVFGHPRNSFIEGDLQFLVKHMHPGDLPAFVHFAETTTLNAAPWRETKGKGVPELVSRIRHSSGKWLWIRQRVVVLSVTPGGHVDTVLLLFDDCTATKQTELEQHASRVEKSRKSSKLLSLLAPISTCQSTKQEVITESQGQPCLTRREKEIMQLVSQGLSSKEIATKLFISRHTVESHRKHILQKLSVKNAPQMVHQSVLFSIREL